MPLELAPLQNAIQRLEESLGYCSSDLAKSDPSIARQFRMAAIQAFEFTYERSWKMLRSYLEIATGTPLESDMNFADLIRTGNEYGMLLGDWPKWKTYREKRGITSHAYDEAKADEVFAILPDFLAEAKFLAKKLAARNA